MTTNENGLAELTMTPTQQGVYQVRAVSGDNVDVQTVFAVSARIAELENIQPTHTLMQQRVAQYKASGTEAVWMSEYDEIQPIIHNKAERTIVQRTTTPLAFAPIWFLLLVPAVMGAVLIRRRHGGR